MAMAVKGKNRHYEWNKIQARHWATTAKHARFATSEADAILDDCAARGPSVLRDVEKDLPADFPEAVAEPILRGVAEALARI